MERVDVLIAGTPTDPHCSAVADHLRSLGAAVLVTPVDGVPALSIAWAPRGRITLADDNGTPCVIDAATTTWWRRPGFVRADGLDHLERQLVSDELSVLWPGVLEAAGVRWVDAPWQLQRARMKPVQLVAAASIGAATPVTIVSGDAAAAHDFARGRRVVAKAVSSGVGIAPFVDVVPPQALDLVRSCPTLLQELVEADTDVRIVTVGDQVFCWHRDRTTDTIDWRAIDPSGTDFQSGSDPTEGKALRIAEVLNLSFSVQDWLLTQDHAKFLEVNPQGQFLFLAGADATVVPSLAEHLLE